ncbi:MAG: TonB-dependent receptor [Prolixibacteraceae bacterium]|jgi:iron complex outermembrane receptor protein
MKKEVMNSRLRHEGAGNLLKKMKLLILFFFTGLLAVSANSYSQETKLSLKFDNVTVKEVFKQIEERSEFVFFYNEDFVDVNRKVSIDVEGENIEDILDEVFKGTNNAFKIYDRQIVILSPELKEFPPTMKSETKNEQKKSLTGSVKDSNGVSLPGVTVVVKGTTIGTITDSNGSYTLLNVPDNCTLIFSFVGMKSQEVKVEGKSTVDVKMVEETVGIDEVVVIGYGTVKKSDATGSVSTVSSREFNKGSMPSAQALITGKTAGVTITSAGGSPQENPQIRIRGGSSISASNDPLFVIDGVPIEGGSVSGGGGNPLLSLNPNDIESFTVLKDASATAIYGSRASNGVILITTKKGTRKFNISYNLVTSVGVIPKTLTLYDGDEYRALVNELYPGNDGYDATVKARLGTANTDWQKQIYHPAVSHDHNLSFSGRMLKMPYRLSLGYTDQNGILKTTNMDRKTVLANLSPSFFKDHLKLNINNKFSFIKNNFGDAGAVGSAVRYDPTQPVRNGNTRWGGYTANMLNVDDINGVPITSSGKNPVAQLAFIDNKSDVVRNIANVQADYKFHSIPDLRANLNLAYDYNYGKGHNNTDSIAPWTYSSSHASGLASEYWEKKEMKLLEFYLNYVNNIKANSSKLDAMVGYSWQHTRDSRYSITTSQGGEFVITPENSPKTEYYLLAFFGRLNYSLKDRYLLTFTLREDGTSRFSPENRWGTFPAVALAWKINDEPFLKNVKSVSELKLRLGYGVTGQQNIGQGDYPYLPIYLASQSTARYQMGYNEDGTPRFYTTLRPEGYDAGIKWEETTTKNIGLDYGFLDNRFTGSIEFYKRETSDLINTIPIPQGSNLKNQILTNVGNLENNGFEFSVNAKVISTKDIYWEVGYNLGYNKTKVTKLTQVDDPAFQGVPTGGISGGTGNGIQIYSVGYAPKAFYVMKQVYDSRQRPIEGVYADLNGDHMINGSDFYRYKQPDPVATMGVSSLFRYKSFDFSFNGRVNLGNYVYNNVASNNGYYINNIFSSSSQLHNLIVQGYPHKFNTAQWYSDYYLENGSFFRMDYMSLGYDISQKPGNKFAAHISLTCQNVFVITKYKGLDPEVASGIDNNFYPRPRTFSLGITVNY